MSLNDILLVFSMDAQSCKQTRSMSALLFFFVIFVQTPEADMLGLESTDGPTFEDRLVVCVS